jgi:hypothetical protein
MGRSGFIIARDRRWVSTITVDFIAFGLHAPFICSALLTSRSLGALCGVRERDVPFG